MEHLHTRRHSRNLWRSRRTVAATGRRRVSIGCEPSTGCFAPGGRRRLHPDSGDRPTAQRPGNHRRRLEHGTRAAVEAGGGRSTQPLRYVYVPFFDLETTTGVEEGGFLHQYIGGFTTRLTSDTPDLDVRPNWQELTVTPDGVPDLDLCTRSAVLDPQRGIGLIFMGSFEWLHAYGRVNGNPTPEEAEWPGPPEWEPPSPPLYEEPWPQQVTPQLGAPLPPVELK